MPPKAHIWNEDLEFRLIFLVERCPILWNPSEKDYRRTDLKETHWEKIAGELGAPVTAEMARKRFTGMRETFMDNERKVRESKQRSSGKGTDEIYKPKWCLDNRLQFLKKSCAQSQSTSNITPIQTKSLPHDFSIPHAAVEQTPQVFSLPTNLGVQHGTVPVLRFAYDDKTKRFIAVSVPSNQADLEDRSEDGPLSLNAQPFSPLAVSTPLMSPLSLRDTYLCYLPVLCLHRCHPPI